LLTPGGKKGSKKRNGNRLRNENVHALIANAVGTVLSRNGGETLKQREGNGSRGGKERPNDIKSQLIPKT